MKNSTCQMQPKKERILAQNQDCQLIKLMSP
jgi:hypothetical protein